jgi:hypothetical protein
VSGDIASEAAAEAPAEPTPVPREVVVSNPSAYVYVDQVDPSRKRAGWWSKR